MEPDQSRLNPIQCRSFGHQLGRSCQPAHAHRSDDDGGRTGGQFATFISSVFEGHGSFADPLEQLDKSVGKKASVLCPITRHATDHADQRTAHGFSTTDIASELRVDPQNGERNLCEEVIRFNEAVDEAVGVSLPRLNTRPARSRDLFLAVAGHDMRDPLSSITPSSQRLLVEENLPDTSHRAARQIHGSAARLGRKLPQKLIDGDMGRVIQEVLEELRVASPSAEVDLDRSGDLRGTWDFGRLAQVVSNPCGIALQHGDATRPTDSQLDLRSVGTRHA